MMPDPEHHHLSLWALHIYCGVMINDCLADHPQIGFYDREWVASRCRQVREIAHQWMDAITDLDDTFTDRTWVDTTLASVRAQNTRTNDTALTVYRDDYAKICQMLTLMVQYLTVSDMSRTAPENYATVLRLTNDLKNRCEVLGVHLGRPQWRGHQWPDAMITPEHGHASREIIHV